MAKRKLSDKLIAFEDIYEELRKIQGTVNAYITSSGQIYLDYGNGKWFPKKQSIIHDYCYCGILYENKTHNTSKRVHRLVAETYIPNPDNLPIVGHKNNIKNDNRVENLYWTTVQENTQKTFDDGYKQPSSWFDDQSVAVAKFDLDGNFIEAFESISEASRNTGMTKTGVLHQCKHKATKKPRKGFYYRYLSEYEESGFIL